MLKQLGGGYGEVLGEHARILRAAFAAHGGQEVDNQGDSFFVAFRTAKEAVEAAVDAQRDLEAHAWPEGARVRVRMGLHTGEPKVGGERYVGIGVHRAARIGDAGHGGQVLLSSTTKELAEEDLPAGVTIRNLGARRLKDLDQPQRLYQLVIDGLPSEFKALRTLDVELKRKRRRLYAGSALIGVAAAAIAIPVFALGQGSSGGGVPVTANSVAVIDPNTNRVSNDITVGSRPGQIVSGFGAVWVANLDDETVSRIDPKTRTTLRAIPVDVEPTSLAAGARGIWLASTGRYSYSNGLGKVRLSHIDPSYDTVGTIELRNRALWGILGPLAATRTSVWVTSASRFIRVDPGTRREALTPLGNSFDYAPLNGIAVDAGGTWVSERDNVVRFDSNGALLQKIPVANGPSAIARGSGFVWVVTADDKVVKIDPSANAVTTSIDVGRSPTGVTVGAGAVWVANNGDGTVSKIDPRANKVVKTFKVGGSPTGILFADGLVWVSVQQRTAEEGRRGGTVGVAEGGPVNPDPALVWSGSLGPSDSQLTYATCAELVNYPDRAGPAGSRLVPEVARSLPSLSADRRTYTFTIRPGFRFSPPSNKSVTAATFKDSLERSLDPRTKGLASFFLGDIVGVKAFEAGKARHVAGVRARGNTLSIRLTDVSGSFLSRLAMSFSCAVPSGTPPDPRGLTAIPSAGPYYVAFYRPNEQLVLRRNPNYHGPRPHRLDEIDVALNLGEAQAVKEVSAGRMDYALNQFIPESESARLLARYGPASPVGRTGRQQYFVNPGLSIWYYPLNEARPLFADARMRRAVNFAVDRQALAGTFGLAMATDQYLPPGIRGFNDAHIYPLRGDVARARRLAGPGRRTAVLYTCDDPWCSVRAQILVRNLAAIGIRLDVKAFPQDVMYKKILKQGEPWDLADLGWGTDGYFDPYDFLNLFFDGNLPHNGNSWNTAGTDISHFNDPAYNRRLEAAAKLAGPARYRAYARLDADLTRNAAPILAYGNPAPRNFFSARIGCQVWGPNGMDLAALCIRPHARP